MSKRFVLPDDEQVIVTVTPTPQGLRGPTVLLILAVGAVVATSQKVSFAHRHEALLLGVLVTWPALVVLTRTWRWRSKKIVLTTHHVLMRQGVLSQRTTLVALDDIVALEVGQRLHERLRRRGVVEITAKSGTLLLGPVRHPDALARVIEQTRHHDRATPVSYSAIFEPTIPPVQFQPWRRNESSE